MPLSNEKRRTNEYNGKKVPSLRFPEFTEAWEEKTLNSFFLYFRGGASLTPKYFVAFSDCEVIPKKGITSGGKLLLDIEGPTYCSSTFFEENLSCVIDESFLITTLRDLVPSGPNIGYIVTYKTNKKYLLAQGVYGFQVDNNQLIATYLI